MLVACHRIHFCSALRFHTNSVALSNPLYARARSDRSRRRQTLTYWIKAPLVAKSRNATHNKNTSHPQQVADRKRNLSATSKSLYHAARSPCAPYALTHNTCLKRAQSKDRCPSVATRHLHSRRWLFRAPRQEKRNCSHNCLLCASPCLNALLSDRKGQKITVLGRAKKMAF